MLLQSHCCLLRIETRFVLPSDARVESGEEALGGRPEGTRQPSLPGFLPGAAVLAHSGLSRNFSSCCQGLAFHIPIRARP